MFLNHGSSDRVFIASLKIRHNVSDERTQNVDHQDGGGEKQPPGFYEESEEERGCRSD